MNSPSSIIRIIHFRCDRYNWPLTFHILNLTLKTHLCTAWPHSPLNIYTSNLRQWLFQVLGSELYIIFTLLFNLKCAPPCFSHAKTNHFHDPLSYFSFKDPDSNLSFTFLLQKKYHVFNGKKAAHDFSESGTDLK